MRGMSAARIRLLVIILAVTVGAPAVASAKSGPITFYFGLKRPEASAQQAFFAVSRPGSSSYRRFLLEAGVGSVWSHARGAASVRASDQEPGPDRAD